MQYIRKNLLCIFLFCVGVVMISYGVKLYNFGVNYEEKSTRNITLVDTSSTTYKQKQNTFYNTTGFFLDDLTGKRFRLAIQDKVYREFEAGGNKPIPMQKELSQENLDNNVHGAIWKLLGVLMFIVGNLFVIWVLVSKFVEYKAKWLHFVKFGKYQE